jgi:hypothetical protein
MMGQRRSNRVRSLLEDGICLRTAWRLQTLADALALGEPATSGFVTLAEADLQPPILELSQQLREQASDIQEKPTDRSIRAAFAVVAPDLASPPEDEPESEGDDGESDGSRPGGFVDDVFGGDVFGNPQRPGGQGSGGAAASGPGPQRPSGPQPGASEAPSPQGAGQPLDGDQTFDPFGE